jgi:PKD repeat protein
LPNLARADAQSREFRIGLESNVKKLSGCLLLMVTVSVLLVGCRIDRNPVALIAMEPSSGYSPLLVHFEAHTSDATSASLSYEWAFGDGTTAIGSIVDHEFTGTGQISIRLTVTDAEGLQTVVNDAVRLLNRIPHAQFTSQPNPAPTHHPIQFDASDSFDPDGEIVSYRWDFGDGDTAVGSVIEHEFEASDIDYRVVLTLTDDSGDVNSTYRDLELIGCDH